MPESQRQVLDFFGALRLIDVKIAARELGLSNPTMQSLCRALGVPILHLGTKRYIDPVQLTIGMKAVSRIGADEFLFPGSKTLKRGTRMPEPHARQLDPKKLRDNLIPILIELAYSRDLLSFKTQEEALRYARRAAERLVVAGFASIPATAQAMMRRPGLKRLIDKHGPDFIKPLAAAGVDPGGQGISDPPAAGA